MKKYRPLNAGYILVYVIVIAVILQGIWTLIAMMLLMTLLMFLILFTVYAWAAVSFGYRYWKLNKRLGK